jgi:DNA-binding HxlR family transcriptional regulator
MSIINKPFRCDCPVTSALDLVGDKWTLVLVKQMLLEYKMTFKDFSQSDSSIAPNILSSRLKKMESLGFIVKKNHPENKKTNLYLLTARGLSLSPIIIELAMWTHENIKPINEEKLNELYGESKDKEKLNQAIIGKYIEQTIVL